MYILIYILLICKKQENAISNYKGRIFYFQYAASLISCVIDENFCFVLQ